ncbi:MAG: phosphatase PAP2 family protein [Candidatus Dojkabacteria bacterium]|nr:phosphatase PAP2 family protein [Candidatus Dojkabacteria bacterium]
MLKNLLRLDEKLSYKIYFFTRNVIPPMFIRLLSILNKFYGAFFIFVLILLASDYVITNLIIFCISLFVSFIVIEIILKNIFKRSRPFYGDSVKINSYSFPSSHAFNSVFFVTVTLNILDRLKYFSFNSSLITIYVFVAVLPGIIRILEGKHYLLDVIASWILGLILGFMITLVF